MALPVIERVAGFARTRWWGLLMALFIVTALAITALVVTVSEQRSFVSDIRTLAGSKVDYLLLCGFRHGVTQEPCQVIVSPELPAVLALLANATTQSPPGKVAPASEMMLRIGRGAVTGRQYLGCVRVARFANAKEIYISEVTTDRDCTRIEKYQRGYVAIPADSLGRGAI